MERLNSWPGFFDRRRSARDAYIEPNNVDKWFNFLNDLEALEKLAVDDSDPPLDV